MNIKGSIYFNQTKISLFLLVSVIFLSFAHPIPAFAQSVSYSYVNTRTIVWDMVYSNPREACQTYGLEIIEVTRNTVECGILQVTYIPSSPPCFEKDNSELIDQSINTIIAGVGLASNPYVAGVTITIGVVGLFVGLFSGGC